MEIEKYKIKEILCLKGIYVGPTVGISMQPMLKDRNDTIVVRPKIERLKRLDVALYKRGKQYVMHRIIEPIDGGYHIRGDNCYYDEIVAEEDVIGVLTEFYHKDKHCFCTDKKYLRYAEKRVNNYKRRLFFYNIKAKLGAGCKKFLRIFKRKKDR